MLADLHIHTTFSDGIYTPEKIVAQARASGITAIAITDHDNIQAYNRAARTIHFRHLDLELIRGVEIDTDYKGKDVHVLGYHSTRITSPCSRPWPGPGWDGSPGSGRSWKESMPWDIP